jgi:hypothetical protein
MGQEMERIKRQELSVMSVSQFTERHWTFADMELQIVAVTCSWVYVLDARLSSEP